MENLGDVLRRKRETLGLSLREVQEKTGISNAYLSQIENHKITQPSPAVLRKLSDFYELSYLRLMQIAGHPTITSKMQKPVLFRTSNGLEELTEEEERELLEYLRFMRMRRMGK